MDEEEIAYRMTFDTRRRDIIAALIDLSIKYPDLRMTQIIGNALGDTDDPYYVEDADLLGALRRYRGITSTEMQAD